MTAKNDITGDALTSRASTQQYRDNYDRIFRSKTCEDPSCEVSSDPVTDSNVGEETKKAE